jgi:CRP/FNR family nitrogen fixation transcriptional regulator
MSRLDMADHLGLTIETISRSLTQLERKGIIGLPTHRLIVLRDREALERLDT